MTAYLLHEQQSQPVHALGSTKLVMSGDCGGTNTRLQIFRVPGDAAATPGQLPPGELVFSKKYLNSSYDSFEDVCKTFLSDIKPLSNGEVPSTCCLACAGGITNNSVSFTNVSKGWSIDGCALEKSLKIPHVKLINDFEAQGYGLLTLTDDEKISLNDAKPRPGSPIACVGAGTGLGECFLTADANGQYTCFPSEGGHVEFSPRDEITDDLFHYLKVKFQLKKRVSVERVVSGPGLGHIYEFLRQHWAYEERVGIKVDQAFLRAPEHMKGAVVAEGAAEGDVLCLKVVDIFSECYGSEAGNAALKWLPYGGLYISGGIGAKNPDWVKGKHFMHAYADKGRLSYCVAQVPLYLVTTEDTGERGALFVAVSLLAK
jgi:glucokinase